MKRILLLPLIIILAFSAIHCSDHSNEIDPPNEPLMETVSDIDGNVYNTVKIGNQIWMLENLKTTTFNDGEAITEYSFGNDWYSADPTPYYQWANTDDLNNVFDEELSFDYYGAMYNHAAIESGKLAPEGWRIPTEQDFIELENFLSDNGYLGNEANALKSTSGWIGSSGNGIDAFGFKGLPNGYVSAVGTPTASEIICSWATSDVNIAENKRRIVNLFDQDTIIYFDNGIQLGAGIRCIKEL